MPWSWLRLSAFVKSVIFFSLAFHADDHFANIIHEVFPLSLVFDDFQRGVESFCVVCASQWLPSTKFRDFAALAGPPEFKAVEILHACSSELSLVRLAESF